MKDNQKDQDANVIQFPGAQKQQHCTQPESSLNLGPFDYDNILGGTLITFGPGIQEGHENIFSDFMQEFFGADAPQLPDPVDAQDVFDIWDRLHILHKKAIYLKGNDAAIQEVIDSLDELIQFTEEASKNNDTEN